MGNLAIDSMNFIYNVPVMLAFEAGAPLFYYLLYKSRVVPRGLSLWGLIAVVPCLVLTLSQAFGFEIPIYIVLLYAPFEPVIGVWILVKGIKIQQE